MSGCSTLMPMDQPYPVSMTDTEKKEIADGKLVKFVDLYPYKGDPRLMQVDNLHLNKDKLPNGIFVCASAWAAPTPNCYPNLSKLVGQNFAARGIKIAKDQSSADAVVYFQASFWYEGQGPNPNFTYAIEQSLINNGTLTLESKSGHGTADAFLIGKLLSLGAMTTFSGMMAGGSGHYADRHLIMLSFSMIDAKTAVEINKAPWASKDADVQRYVFKGRYIGPVKANESASPLYEQAMTESLDHITNAPVAESAVAAVSAEHVETK